MFSSKKEKKQMLNLFLCAFVAVAMLTPSSALSQVSLGRVVVIGKRVVHNVHDTRRAFAEMQEEFDLMVMYDLMAFMQLAPNEIHEAVAALTACGNNSRITQQTKNTTSHEPVDEVRAAAATNIIDSSFSRNQQLLMAGRTMVVMYSDGGYETYQISPASSAHVRVANTLRLGDGVAGSACRSTG